MDDKTGEDRDSVTDTDSPRLSRSIHPMPDFLSTALAELCLLEACRSRPASQQLDPISWIFLAKRARTREKRLHQMLEERRRGEVWMKMDYRPSRGSE